MIICLGKNIKYLRIARGITQEQFGYEIGVSAQAVSRWENGITYPDISTLPVIADFFGVSLDKLMGRGQELNVAERDAFFERISKMRDNCESEAVLKEYDKMLYNYPNDPYLLYGKANCLYLKFKKCHDKAIAKNIVSLCDKINCSNKPDMQCGANALLVRVYAQTGEIEEARRLALELPSFEVGRELLMLESLDVKKKKEQYEYLIERFKGKIEFYKKKIRECSI